MILRFMLILACLFHAPVYAVFKSDNTQLLKQWLAGVHYSTNNTIQDKRVHIALEVLPIWQDRDDGEWLYFEGHITDSKKKPFHQRIIHLVKTLNNQIRLYNYSIPRASDFAGAYYAPDILSSLTLSQLTINNNCEFLIKLGYEGIFTGEAGSNGCDSGYSGLLFMSTSFTVSQSGISFLDGTVKDKNVRKRRFKPLYFNKKEFYHGLVR